MIYVCGMQGQFEAAIADYTQALALDPGHCRTLYNRASCYDRLQRLPEALADYSAAIALDQGSARAFYTRHASTCTCSVKVLLRFDVRITQNSCVGRTARLHSSVRQGGRCKGQGSLICCFRAGRECVSVWASRRMRWMTTIAPYRWTASLRRHCMPGMSHHHNFPQAQANIFSDRPRTQNHLSRRNR